MQKENLEILAIIPARGGSKSIPLKNIKLFAGKPLICYSIEVALDSHMINRVIVSTDSLQISEIAKAAGAEVPFLRPEEIARDDTLDFPVFEHCLEWLKEKESYEPDIIVHLRPTSPLRSKKMVDASIQKLIDDPKADSVRAICEPSQNPFKMWTVSDAGYLNPLVQTDIHEQYNQPRQVLPQVYWQNGYVDVTRRKTITEKKSMTGERIRPLIVDSSNIIDIDNEITFSIAEMMLNKEIGSE